MHTSISIVDYKNDRKIFIVFIDNDFTSIHEIWDRRNSFTQELRNFTKIPHIKMSSLDLNDWKLSIIEIVELVLQLSHSEQIDLENIKTKCMHDILLGYSYKYKLDTGNNLDYMQIHRIKDNEYSFIFSSSDLMLEADEQNET